ncbi:hypothetical protein Clacol_005442 [Clathrus columnatus]|uniref:Uncharacterized protein n=1 Tax=Clathrus columnatus TaxID=1419009 RepID=A0AAV5AE85_9AGAM|nr:hypothetical protein Clacol_005442 [Clathrus columnatus]
MLYSTLSTDLKVRISSSCKLDVTKGFYLTFTIEWLGKIELPNETRNILPEQLKSVEPTDIFLHNTLGNQGDREDTWVSFLSHFETLKSLAEKFPEDSYTPTLQVQNYIAWARNILSMIPDDIIAQSKYSKTIDELSQHLKEICECITGANEVTQRLLVALFALIQQTIECAYFVRELGRIKTTSTVWKGVNIAEKAKDFHENLNHITDAITYSFTWKTSFVTLLMRPRILKGDAKSLYRFLIDRILLDEMPYAQNSGYLPEKGCLPGTRQELITEFFDWVKDDVPKRVFLLLGQAGSGKSAVAHTIASVFDEQERLGSFFPF